MVHIFNLIDNSVVISLPIFFIKKTMDLILNAILNA